MFGFIVNPVSGNGRGAKTWKLLEQRLQGDSIPYRVRFTTAPGDAVLYAKEMAASGQYDAIAAVGGDGTVKETVTGIVAAHRLKDGGRSASPSRPCSFGYIPAGSGNDFARGHGIPSDPLAALDVLLAVAGSGKSAASADLLQAGGSIAASSISCGFDAQVALTTNTAFYKKWLNRIGMGKLAYVISVVRVLLTYQPRDVAIRVDGEESRFRRVWLVAVSNIPFYGGGLKINPAADPQDGLAAVCVAFGITRWQLLRLFPLVFTGKHVGHPAVRFFAGRSVEILSAHPLPVQADGDPVGEEVRRIDILSGALSVLKPAAARIRPESSPEASAAQIETAG